MASEPGKRPATVTTVAGGSVIAILLAFWNLYQDAEADSKRELRNQQQAAICDSVNRVVNMNGVIIRESIVTREGQTPEQRERIERLRGLALDELDKARCEVSPVD